MPNNTLEGIYDPIWYAQEALIHLENSLGMATRVHRDSTTENQQRGSTASFTRPSTFTAQDAPSTAQDVLSEKVDVVLDKWKEVKFALTDKEVTFGKERIIRDHIRPAAYAIANNIDSELCNLYKQVPWSHDVASTPGVSDLTAAKRVLFDNSVPMGIGDLSVMIDGSLQDSFEQLTAFSQYQGGGDEAVRTQMEGQIGRKFGMDVFANQNVKAHTSGTVVSAGTDVAGAVNNAGGYAKGATSMAIDGLSLVETLVAGDSFVIAGNTQRYVVTADVTLAAGAGTVSFAPGLAAAVADNAVVTFEDGSGGSIHADSFSANMAFHRNAFMLATAPLSTMASQLGARVETVTDPITNLSLRSRLYYVGNSSEIHVSLDVLYGVKCLDHNMATLLRRDV